MGINKGTNNCKIGKSTLSMKCIIIIPLWPLSAKFCSQQAFGRRELNDLYISDIIEMNEEVVVSQGSV